MRRAQEGEFCPNEKEKIKTIIRDAIAAKQKILLKLDFDQTMIRTDGKLNPFLVELVSELLIQFGPEHFELGILSARMPDEELDATCTTIRISDRLFDFLTQINRPVFFRGGSATHIAEKNIECLKKLSAETTHLFVYFYFESDNKKIRGRISEVSLGPVQQAREKYPDYQYHPAYQQHRDAVIPDVLKQEVIPKHGPGKITHEATDIKSIITKAERMEDAIATHKKTHGRDAICILIDDNQDELKKIQHPRRCFGLRCLPAGESVAVENPQKKPQGNAHCVTFFQQRPALLLRGVRYHSSSGTPLLWPWQQPAVRHTAAPTPQPVTPENYGTLSPQQ